MNKSACISSDITVTTFIDITPSSWIRVFPQNCHQVTVDLQSHHPSLLGLKVEFFVRSDIEQWGSPIGTKQLKKERGNHSLNI